MKVHKLEMLEDKMGATTSRCSDDGFTTQISPAKHFQPFLAKTLLASRGLRSFATPCHQGVTI